MWLSVLMAPSIQATPQMSNAASKPITQAKGAKYTRARLPVKLLYSEAFASKPEAMSAEALFKKKAERKTSLYQRTHGKNNRVFF